jgi:hypothetical protein
MSGPPDGIEVLGDRDAALIRVAVLLSIDSDPSTLRWAIEDGVAAGIDDAEIFDLLQVVAPIIGMGRLGAALPDLMAALDLEIVEG